MKHNRIVFIGLVAFLCFCQSPALAARPRVAKTSAGTKTTVVTGVSLGVASSVKLSPDRRSLLITFSKFDNLKSGSYELTYNGSGHNQGAGGSILLGDSSTKSLLFGTCSKGVCTYHTNITNARLRITSNLKDGRKVVKSYLIKV